MMKNYDQSVEINHNPNRSYIPDHPYRILIAGDSGSGKTNLLLDLTKHQRPDIDKIYLYVKDPFESEHQLLINGREKIGIESLKNPKAFVDYSQTVDDVYGHLEDYNPTKKRRVLIVFDDMISDMESNKKLSPIATELFLRGRKLNFLLTLISQSYFKVSKFIRLDVTHYFIMKIPKKFLASNHSFEIDFTDCMTFYEDYTKEPYSFLVKDTTLSSENPLPFRKNVL